MLMDCTLLVWATADVGEHSPFVCVLTQQHPAGEEQHGMQACGKENEKAEERLSVRSGETVSKRIGVNEERKGEKRSSR